MYKTLRNLVLPMLVLWGPVGLPAQTSDPANIEEPTVFTTESFGHSVPIPPDVVKAIMRTSAAKDGLLYLKEDHRKDLSQFFRAIPIHLANTHEVDLLVLGIDWMTGADNDWFWIVRATPLHAKVLLFAGGNSVEILPSRTNGFRDIRGMFYTANEKNDRVFHFNGSTYKLWKQKWTPVQ